MNEFVINKTCPIICQVVAGSEFSEFWKKMSLIIFNDSFCHTGGSVYHRSGTYENASEEGDDWKRVRGKRLKNIAVGENVVVGTDRKGNVHVRIGIDDILKNFKYM